MPSQISRRRPNTSTPFATAIDSAEDHIQAKLGEIVAGNAPGRRSDGEITVFDNGGTGIETVATASLLSERAREKGLSTEIEFSPASEALTGY